MVGFNYERGRSNNMVDAESRGMMTVGRWANRYGVSARAVIVIMHPTEAHHTGAGHVGRSQLTPVLHYTHTPTNAELVAMRDFDRTPLIDHLDCTARWLHWTTQRYRNRGRTCRRRVPHPVVSLGTTVRVDCQGGIQSINGKPAYRLAGVVILSSTGELIAHSRVSPYENLSEITADLRRRASEQPPGAKTDGVCPGPNPDSPKENP